MMPLPVILHNLVGDCIYLKRLRKYYIYYL